MENTIKEKKKTPFYKKWWLWVVVIFLLLISLAGRNKSQKIGESSNTNNSTTASNIDLKDLYNLNDIIKVSDFEFTVFSAKEYISENQFIKPKDGNKLIKVELMIENKGDKKETVSSMLNFYLKDSDGVKGVQSFIADDKSIDGEFLKGDKIKGTITYEVSKDSKGLKLYYNPSFILGKSIVIDLKI
jgi:Domain of unknown function (DUF4352)